jgi:hypothetical protein
LRLIAEEPLPVSGSVALQNLLFLFAYVPAAATSSPTNPRTGNAGTNTRTRTPASEFTCVKPLLKYQRVAAVGNIEVENLYRIGRRKSRKIGISSRAISIATYSGVPIQRAVVSLQMV